MLLKAKDFPEITRADFDRGLAYLVGRFRDWMLAFFQDDNLACG